jgi:RimJ/RimL family protein N-acetyltransferase
LFKNLRIELYFGLSHDHWGRDFATEAAYTLLKYGFRTIRLDTIFAVVNKENKASRRVIEKLGMLFSEKLTDLPAEHQFYEGHLLFFLDRDKLQPGDSNMQGLIN